MKIALWENPRKKGQVRLYINGLIPYQEDGRKVPKIWLEKLNDVAVVKLQRVKNACIDEDEAAKLFRAQLVKDKYIESEDLLITWEMALSFVEESMVKKKESYRNARISGENKSMDKQATQAAKDAFQLDLRTIKFDEVQHITVDHREPLLLTDMLIDHPMLDVTIASLEVGDIHIHRKDGAKIIIERKDCDKDIGQKTDFESSVIDDDKRLFNQSERMKFEPDSMPVFMLEGDVYNNAHSMMVQQIDGALSFLVTVQGMNVLNTLNLPHSAYMITKLCKHFTEGLGYEVALRPKKPKAILDSKAFVLEGITGVSGSLARNLLHHFGSIKNVSNAEIEQLIEVEGIGPQKALHIYKTLND